ncbi:MAG TPA: cation-translocating P-type ATPase [Candidatus Lachnoclostridium stercorigallinarum]|uniref:Cation-translocating P-type ATPase n=1 Tax=Candidatus Lachnoclostridium stercorigallinarum TaxID=2838634 RepID=A0A9D2K6C7_9FIRM|nr:cation-translocating P-type ATPase [Candidatus Lachnoclostridium stercorigallinarum]
MRAWYQMSEEEALQSQSVGKEGLTEAQAQERLEKNGQNVLQETRKKSAFQVFLEQFKDLLVIILIVAALISMVSGNVESTVVIFAVIIMNAVLGTIQHEKAEKSLDSLKSLSSPIAKVMRDGKKMEIDSRDVVPGDILLLEAGDLVVADGRVLESYSLQVNESSLTGESTNVDKKALQLNEDKVALADQVNMVFSSSLVTFGRGVVLVTGTGMNTEIGKIASLMNATKEKKTPLQVSLDQFSSKLAAVIMIISALVFLLSLYRQMPILDSLMFAVALAVAAIPEALSSIVTIVQAMGTQKMAAEHAIIKDLKAVESLGCVSVICSDKTGTLTQNKMTVQQIYMDEKLCSADALKNRGEVSQYLLYASLLANDAAFTDGKMIGDPTEFALIEMGRKAGTDENTVRSELPRTGEIPFDSDRKLMSTRHMIFGKDTLLTKGAVDVLLPRITRIMTSSGVRPATESDRQKIVAQNMEFSRQGLRVLAFACREMKEGETLTFDSERDYTFVGLVSMMDPPRPESKNAVLNAKKAGIRPVMITGDHKVTATAIAEKIGIFTEGDLAVEGLELDQMDDKELDEKLERISVYARVSPEHKIRIVEAWQNKGRIVAMTGDGVNDAPALKKADIGVAMGITGTEVSKDAAAMILADDNFATIIKAVSNGRNVYRNIKNSIKFLLSGNMAGILSVLYTSLMGLPVPFAPVHLLFINLLTDSLPAIAIGMEPAEPGLLEQPPRNPKEGILTKEFLVDVGVQGGIIAVCTMIAYYTGLYMPGVMGAPGNQAVASTMAFATLTLARLFHGFNCRSKHSIIRLGLRSNPWSIMAFGAGVVLLAAVLFVPGLQRLFSVADLSVRQLVTIAIFAVIPTLIIQAVKTIRESMK